MPPRNLVFLVDTSGSMSSDNRLPLLKQALAAYHIGVMSCLAMCLGCLFWVMAFHLTQAGWSVTVRRQFENVMALLPIVAGMAIITVAIEMWTGGHLFAWMNREVQATDVLFQRKAAYFTPDPGMRCHGPSVAPRLQPRRPATRTRAPWMWRCAARTRSPSC